MTAPPKALAAAAVRPRRRLIRMGFTRIENTPGMPTPRLRRDSRDKGILRVACGGTLAQDDKRKLFDFVLGGVAVARDDVVLDIFALFVLQGKWTAIGRLQLDLHFAEGSILLGIGGAVGDHVFVADVGRNVAKSFLEIRS